MPPVTATDRSRLSVVIVTHDSRQTIGRVLGALRDQLGDEDEVVVVDNASADGTADEVQRVDPLAVLVRSPENLGFAEGCNIGAARADGDLLVFLNPDAVPAPGFADAIRRPLEVGAGWSAWMGLVTMAGGTKVNTSGGVVHFTGIAWAGGAGRDVGEVDVTPHEVGFVSGACMAVPNGVWTAAGGLPREHFMYYEDVDLSLRLRLVGARIGIEPSARVDHEYEFVKGAAKWRRLERNRWATIVRTYPGGLLLALAPAFVATEITLLAVALRGGWLRDKLIANGELARALPRLLNERRTLEAARRVSAAAFADCLTADLSSPFLGRVSTLRPLQRCLRAYWAVVRAILHRAERRTPAPPASTTGGVK
jgi:GT2 family glycosyltransferase